MNAEQRKFIERLLLDWIDRETGYIDRTAPIFGDSERMRRLMKERCLEFQRLFPTE